MREKLRNTQGETLVEVLASILICALSIALLFGAVMASVNINQTAQEADARYYEELSAAELQKEDEHLTDPYGIHRTDPFPIIVRNMDAALLPPGNRKQMNVYFYGGGSLISYAKAGGGP
ncbi:MAG: hypothetical protein OSJ58_09780 [Dysosmobacter sp.]|nr:hypothetical protein [Dysosmobacter sp.]